MCRMLSLCACLILAKHVLQNGSFSSLQHTHPGIKNLEVTPQGECPYKL